MAFETKPTGNWLNALDVGSSNRDKYANWETNPE
jgi:hypothetical protein